MKSVATKDKEQSTGVALYDPQLIATLKSSMFPGAKDESIILAIEYCKHAKLDIMLKPVHIVPIWVVDKTTGKGEMRDVIMPGINLYRIQAARSGCMGISEPEFGEDVSECLGGVDITYPKTCKVTAKRMVAGKIGEWTATERWKENYATAGKDKQTGAISNAPNAMWKKRPYAQLAKCAEAQALRKAFPEIGAMPTAEEMEGKQLDSDEFEELQKIKPVAGKGVQGLKDKLKAVNPVDPEREPVDFDGETGEVLEPEFDEVPDETHEDQVTYETIEFLMEAATSARDLMEAMKQAKDMSPDDKKKVSALFNKRQTELRNKE